MSIHNTRTTERLRPVDVFPYLTVGRLVLVAYHTTYTHLQGSGIGDVHIQVGTVIVTAVFIAQLFLSQIFKQTVLKHVAQRDEIAHLLGSARHIQVVLSLHRHFVCHIIAPFHIGIHYRRIAQAKTFKRILIEHFITTVVPFLLVEHHGVGVAVCCLQSAGRRLDTYGEKLQRFWSCLLHRDGW